jgi:hypothetical protein
MIDDTMNGRTSDHPAFLPLGQVSDDGLTHSEEALRDMIDTVGIDRVVFGTDGPADMALDGPVSWQWSLESLSQAEQAAIRWKSLETRLGIRWIFGPACGSRWHAQRAHRSRPNLGNRTGRKRPCQGGR